MTPEELNTLAELTAMKVVEKMNSHDSSSLAKPEDMVFEEPAVLTLVPEPFDPSEEVKEQIFQAFQDRAPRRNENP